MLSSLVGCFLLAWLSWKLYVTRRNYEIAKTAGFPAFYSPAHITDVWWLASYRFLVPALRYLPSSLSEPWTSLCQVWNVWKIGHAPYKAVGSDSIMLATPRGNILWTCDAAVVRQVMQQHGKTVMPTDIISFFEIWGPSITTVEGDEWKKHRRIVTAGFNPTTNAAVWTETLRQTQLLTDRVASQGSIFKVMKDWTLRLTLNVLSGVLFNRKLDFEDYSQNRTTTASDKKLDFQEALITVVLQLGVIVTLPRALLPYMPSATVRKAGQAFKDLTASLHDLNDSAVRQIEGIREKKYKTVLESVVLAATPEGTKAGEKPLTPEDVFGNLFLMLLAGHETTGNTLCFTLMLLALFPEYQQQIHAEIDQQLGGRLESEWSVERDLNVLQAGMVGAVQKEVLRLYQVVQFIWRRTMEPLPVVDSNGITHVIPKGTLCCSSWSTVPRHPDAWTEREVASDRKTALHDSPALYFDPTRWLEPRASELNDSVSTHYFPFGLGPRACPGKAFATVELTAAMAGIFSQYSLELVISEKTLKECGGDKSKAWVQTRDRAIRSLYDDITSVINIELHKELPIRLVKREV